MGKNKTLNHTKEELITLNTITCEEEKYPIWEVASSHMARCILVGNLYKEVKDPNLIAKNSGHIENSRACSRYRDIDEEMAKEVILKLEEFHYFCKNTNVQNITIHKSL